MGLFGRSNADKIADTIREHAKFILLQLNGIDEVFCRDGGATLYNVKELSLYLQRIAQMHKSIQEELDKLSATQQSRVVLPWVNGKLYDLYTWNFSYQMVMSKIKQEIDKLIG